MIDNKNNYFIELETNFNTIKKELSDKGFTVDNENKKFCSFLKSKFKLGKYKGYLFLATKSYPCPNLDGEFFIKMIDLSDIKRLNVRKLASYLIENGYENHSILYRQNHTYFLRLFFVKKYNDCYLIICFCPIKN